MPVPSQPKRRVLGGKACELCNVLYNGSVTAQCTTPCPTDVSGFVCHLHGRCNRGACDCEDGYYGLHCTERCDRYGNAPCSGHGVCNTVSCVCDAGWHGDQCALLDCPIDMNRVMCGGHGTCESTSGLCHCDASWSGPACSIPFVACPTQYAYSLPCDALCPVGGSGQICNGRGECDTGLYGSGWCLCDAGFAGVDCALMCPISRQFICGGISRGLCTQIGTCDCREGTAGELRSRLSSRPDGDTYSSHGLYTVVFYTRQYFYGPNAALPLTTAVARAVARAVPSHGFCHCTSSANDGHWAGLTCTVCDSGWSDASCTAECPLGINGLHCSGRGTCTQGGLCSCYQDSVAGHWEGLLCDRCTAGYYGANCAEECSGGSCNACNGHGICADGQTRDGSCTCLQSSATGWWISLL